MSSSTARKASIEQRQRLNRERREQAAAAQRRRMMMIAGAITVAIAVVFAAFFISRDSSGKSPESAMVLPNVVTVAAVDYTAIPQDGRLLGDPNAPVTLIEWADYQCPFCGAFNREIMPRIIADYVVTGKINIDIRDLPFLDSASGYGESDMAAEAAACAADQGKFWEFHDVIFANQFGENQGAFSKVRLTAMAEKTGLDMNQFSACFEARTHQAEVAAMQAEAIELGITSTPTLMIDGKIVRYTGSYEVLAAAIDAAVSG